MENMKKILFLIPCLMLFTACEGLLEGLIDGDVDNEDNVPDIGLDEAGDENGEGSEDKIYLIKSVNCIDDEGMYSEFTYEYEFIESFGKYMPVSENFNADGEDYGTAVWEYGSGYINRILMYNGEEDYRWIYRLDSENRINGSIEEISLQEGNTDLSCNVEYNSEGYLVSESGNSENHEYSIEYVWENDNLIIVNTYEHYEGTDLNGDGFVDDNDIIDRRETLYYKYSGYPNNTNLDLNDFLCGSYESGLLSDGPARLGITGKRSDNLGYISDETGSAEADFQFDENGNPVKIVIKRQGTDGPVTNTYEITYITK